MINQSPDPSVRYQSTPTVRTALVDLAAQRLTRKVSQQGGFNRIWIWGSGLFLIVLLSYAIYISVL